MRIGAPLKYFALVVDPNGSPVSDTRNYFEELPLLRTVQLHFGGYLGAWSDEAHFTLHDVDQLGQFIKLVFSKNPSLLRNPWVVIIRGWAADLVRVRDHCAKLQQSKRLSE